MYVIIKLFLSRLFNFEGDFFLEIEFCVRVCPNELGYVYGSSSSVQNMPENKVEEKILGPLKNMFLFRTHFGSLFLPVSGQIVFSSWRSKNLKDIPNSFLKFRSPVPRPSHEFTFS